MYCECVANVRRGEMASRSIGFAVAEEDLPLLDELVEKYGGGNRSELLRVAMRRLRHDAWAEKMRTLQADARAEMGGRVYTPDEVQALVKQVLAENRE